MTPHWQMLARHKSMSVIVAAASAAFFSGFLTRKRPGVEENAEAQQLFHRLERPSPLSKDGVLKGIWLLTHQKPQTPLTVSRSIRSSMFAGLPRSKVKAAMDQISAQEMRRCKAKLKAKAAI